MDNRIKGGRYKVMRLTDFEIESIKETICKRDPDAKIYIFGSRVDDNARGGDIDMLIMSDKLQQKNSREIKNEILDRIGEQKIDIVISKDDSKPFVRIALEKGMLI